jgi:ABC-2 type transport system permease protein
MRQWTVLFAKEMLEMKRNAKWLWVPLVMILLGIMQPVTTYYTPQILKSMGGLPKGAVLEIPLPTGGEVLAKALSQYGTLGVLILVLASMAVVSGERQSGVAAMILVKPVSRFAYISAKWAGLLVLTLVSFFCGYMAAWYYTGQLIGKVPFAHVLQSFALYGLWLVFIVTVTLLMSVLFKANGAIAFAAFATAAILSIVTRLAAKYMAWSPSRLADQAGLLLTKGAYGEHLALTLSFGILLIAGVLTLCVFSFRKQELAD